MARFDGSALYEHLDPRQGFHPEWNTYIFNFGRNEVRSFLLGSAKYWLEEFHADGIRVDAVSSMLYLDYGRKSGEWIPNIHGGNENLEAISFLKELNQQIYARHPGVMMIAEESTSWPGVSRPLYVGGLGFGFKWDMGWMHDTLDYFSKEPIYRRFHHRDLTFGFVYAWFENFMLPLSHDEVVYGKRSLIDKMPGDRWQKFANLRALFGYMWARPGKKILFMGGEFGQWREWNHDASLDWNLLDESDHRGVQNLIRDLNRIYRAEPALWEADHQAGGLSVDRCQQYRRERDRVHANRAVERAQTDLRMQLRARRAHWLSRRRSGARSLSRNSQQRLDDVRRKQPGQCGCGDRRANSVARTSVFDFAQAATARDGVVRGSHISAEPRRNLSSGTASI